MGTEQHVIPIELKIRCVKAYNSGMKPIDIYKTIFIPEMGRTQTLKSFRLSMLRWRQKTEFNVEGELTLNAGTYDGFIAHDATVQVGNDGVIKQAWIKQAREAFDEEEFIDILKNTIEPYEYELKSHDDATDMLEIPLFDMHWGVCFFDDYKRILDEIIGLIRSKHWKKIVVLFGQDLFHNDSVVNGETTKGTIIDKVDMIKAVKDALKFFYALIDICIECSNDVKVIYTPGNHDRSTAWMAMQSFLVKYGNDIVDDTMEPRKVITYGDSAIMFTHGDSRNATPGNLAHIFPVIFPKEFGEAKVREIHAGHLHSESDTDIYGIMTRRLSTAVKLTEWTNWNDYVGTHKRFMLFVWDEHKLKSINYI